MQEKLSALAAHLTEVEQQLADPAVYADREKLTALRREQKELAPVVECWQAYLRAQDTAREAEEMLSDSELRALAQEELAGAKGDMERLQEELKRLLLPRDPNDEKNVILEIRAGIGGEEGALFAADLLRMYTMYAERRGWTLSIVSENMTELGGVKEVSAEIEGAGAWSRLKFEADTPGTAGAGDGVLRAHPDLRRHGGGDAGGGGGGVFHRPQGPADRHVPFLRRGGTAREQDGERHTYHPSAHGRGGGVPG